MHAKDLRSAGETQPRIYSLDAWRETPLFNARQRAALASGEAGTAPMACACSSGGLSPIGTNAASALVLQRLLNLLADWVIGRLLAVEVVDRGGKQVRLPRRTDTRRVFENRGQELVFVGVIIG